MTLRYAFDSDIFEEIKAFISQLGATNVGDVRIEVEKHLGGLTKATIQTPYGDRAAGQAFIRAIGDDYYLRPNTTLHSCKDCACKVKVTAYWQRGRIKIVAYEFDEVTREELKKRTLREPAGGEND